MIWSTIEREGEYWVCVQDSHVRYFVLPLPTLKEAKEALAEITEVRQKLPESGRRIKVGK